MVLRISLVFLSIIGFTGNYFAQGNDCINLYPFIDELTGLYGYINCKGIVIFEPQFKNAEFFSDGMGRVEIQNESVSYVGYVNSSKSVIRDRSWSAGQDFSEGLALVEISSEERSKYSFIDKNGSIKLRIRENPTHPLNVVRGFSDDLAVVCYEDKGCGAINKKGDFVIPPKFDYLGDFDGGIADIGLGEKMGVINKKGEVFSLSEKTLIARNGLAVYEKNTGEWAYLDNNGKESFTIIADHSRYFSNELAVISFYQEGYLDKWKLVPLSKNGYIDKNGKIVIEPKFDSAGDFKYEMAEVEVNGKSGVINKTGEFVLPPIYDSIFSYDNCGIFLVKKGDRDFYINKNLKTIWENKVSLFNSENGVISLLWY